MLNKFKFHAVGQGLFYTGQLRFRPYYYHRARSFNFVYDCGSISGHKFLDDAIDQFRHEAGTTDLCVVSHLHRDHYNGLHRLNKIGIRRIILPYLPNYRNLKLVYIVGQYFESGTGEITESDIENVNLMLSLYGVIDRDGIARETEIDGFDADKRVAQEDGFQYFKLEFKDLPDGETNYWNFEFYNKSISDEKWNAFNKNLEDFLRENHIDELSAVLTKDNLLRIASIYFKVFGKNLNATSVIMKHYPERISIGYSLQNDVFWDKFEDEIFPPWHYHNTMKGNNVSVLTGDAEFDTYLRSQVLDNENVAVLQVPHHGAMENWKELRLPQNFECKLVIPYGLLNSYDHPDKDTVKAIFAMKYCSLILVTQCAQYAYFIID